MPGSPLNRVSFLRPDTTFLSQALKHETSRFILFNNLNPLVKSADRLAYASYSDVQPVVGDPYKTAEEDLIKEYNSALYHPQLVFLGLDESKKQDGFSYKEHYAGQPYWALDVTPRASVTEAAEALIKKVEGQSLYFAQGRMQLSLVAPEGTLVTLSSQCPLSTTHAFPRPQPPCTPRAATCSTGTRATPTAPAAATRRCPRMAVSSGHAHQRTWPSG